MNPTESGPVRRNVWRSFGHAFAGAAVVLCTQRSARIHAGFTVAVALLGAVVQLPLADWLWLILAVTMVWSAEAFNTAIEFLSDVVCPTLHPGIKNVKDVASAAVLCTVIGAVAVGILVLGPPLWMRLTGR